MVLEQVELLTTRLTALTAKIAALSRQATMPRQLQTMPGVGPIGASAIETFKPPMDQFRRGRDFAATQSAAFCTLAAAAKISLLNP